MKKREYFILAIFFISLVLSLLPVPEIIRLVSSYVFGGSIGSFIIAKFVIGMNIQNEMDKLKGQLNEEILFKKKLESILNCRVELEGRIKNELYNNGLISKDNLTEVGGVISSEVDKFLADRV